MLTKKSIGDPPPPLAAAEAPPARMLCVPKEARSSPMAEKALRITDLVVVYDRGKLDLAKILLLGFL